MTPIRTPDGRYIVVRGRLWRATRPDLPEAERAAHVSELSSARRAIKAGDLTARARVQAAKVALGERGPVWWTDGAPDENRKLAKNSTYAAWYADLAGPVADAILALVGGRETTVCPSEVARALDPDAWRDRMDDVRAAATVLAERGVVVATRSGTQVDPLAPGGPIRLSRGPEWPG